MNRIAIRCILAMLSAFSLALAVSLLQPGAASAQEQKAQVIELSAKKYEYSSSPLHVKVGAKILLKITATDHDHGFKIAAVPDGAESSGGAGLLFTSPQDCWQLKKGETSAINARHIHLQMLSLLRSGAQRHEGPNYCRAVG